MYELKYLNVPVIGFWCFVIGCAVVLGISGCGDDSAQDVNHDNATDNNATNNSSSANSSVNSATSCPAGGEICDGRCIDPQVNMNHCGECNNACQPNRSSCRDGQCQCLRTTDVICDGECADLMNNATHCGECNIRCPGGSTCSQGECVSITEIQEVIDVVMYTNQARLQGQDCGEYGYKPATHELTMDQFLNEAAYMHSVDMAQGEFMSHDGSDGSDFVERIQRTDFIGAPVGENVAMGYGDGQAVVQGWIDSDGHCQNLMNPDATLIGVGIERSAGGVPYWTQLFGR